MVVVPIPIATVPISNAAVLIPTATDPIPTAAVPNPTAAVVYLTMPTSKIHLVVTAAHLQPPIQQSWCFQQLRLSMIA